MPESVETSLPARRSNGRTRRGPDVGAVVWATIAAFLIVLVAMAMDLRAPRATTVLPRPIVVRRIYRTTVIEQTVPSGAPSRSRSTSVSSTGSVPASPVRVPAAPLTRTS